MEKKQDGYPRFVVLEKRLASHCLHDVGSLVASASSSACFQHVQHLSIASCSYLLSSLPNPWPTFIHARVLCT